MSEYVQTNDIHSRHKTKNSNNKCLEHYKKNYLCTFSVFKKKHLHFDKNIWYLFFSKFFWGYFFVSTNTPSMGDSDRKTSLAIKHM